MFSLFQERTEEKRKIYAMADGKFVIVEDCTH